MADHRSIVQAQQEFFRRALDTARGGVALKVLASKCGLPEATLRSYFRADAPAVMPLGALWALSDAAPAELIDLLLPDGMALVRLPDGMDHAEFVAAALDYAASYAAARHPESEAGEAIGPREDRALSAKGARLSSVGGR